jgi:hypothetical protein
VIAREPNRPVTAKGSLDGRSIIRRRTRTTREMEAAGKLPASIVDVRIYYKRTCEIENGRGGKYTRVPRSVGEGFYVHSRSFDRQPKYQLLCVESARHFICRICLRSWAPILMTLLAKIHQIRAWPEFPPTVFVFVPYRSGSWFRPSRARSQA